MTLKEVSDLQDLFLQTTGGLWGVSVSGDMVVTPPNELRHKYIAAGMPFPSRRVAICEESYYTPAPENLRNAEWIAEVHGKFAEILEVLRAHATE